MNALCVIIPSLKSTGPTNVAIPLIKSLSAIGWNVCVFSLSGGPLADVLDSCNISYKIANTPKWKIYSLLSELNAWLVFHKVKKIHTHCFIPDMLAFFKRNEYEWYSTIHNYPNVDYLLEYGKLKGSLFCFFHVNFIKQAYKAIGCSMAVQKNLIELGVHSSTFVNNGIQLESYYREDEAFGFINTPTNDGLQPCSGDLYLFVGRLIERKNPVAAYEKFMKLANEHDRIIFCGDGPVLDKLINITSGDKRVKILGHIDNVISYYQLADYLILPSIAEGYPMAVLEAMACGCIPILSGIPPHLELYNKFPDSVAIFSEINSSLQLKKLHPITNEQRYLLGVDYMALQYANVFSG